ncbi:hypothetical protein [Secundilactobacillus paracollinoides]|uniref:hypothetical protein n=1 Tax=Secundilactobacillus paracollinoides TaxID=240427 RepID=UPI0006CF7E27|nr:hypothetical protein [Secundilactobacillus paracollinoides]
MKNQFPGAHRITLPEEIQDVDEWLTQEMIEDALTRAGYKFKRRKEKKQHKFFSLLKKRGRKVNSD